jgi:hypothetical protein
MTDHDKCERCDKPLCPKKGTGIHTCSLKRCHGFCQGTGKKPLELGMSSVVDYGTTEEWNTDWAKRLIEILDQHSKVNNIAIGCQAALAHYLFPFVKQARAEAAALGARRVREAVEGKNKCQDGCSCGISAEECRYEVVSSAVDAARAAEAAVVKEYGV